jgi:transcriptional regulator with XRE-family HTH domain
VLVAVGCGAERAGGFMPTFGEALRIARERRGVTTNKLADAAGVDHANLYRVESGKRQAMSLRMCFELVMAIPDPTPEERRYLMDVAILDRTGDEWHRYLIYEFVATADSAALDRIGRAARASFVGDDEARAVLQDQSVIQMLLWIAEDPASAPYRAALAPHIARHVAIDFERQAIAIG